MAPVTSLVYKLISLYTITSFSTIVLQYNRNINNFKNILLEVEFVCELENNTKSFNIYREGETEAKKEGSGGTKRNPSM